MLSTTTQKCAALGAGALLALQIVGALEYTAGGTLYTQASMIGAMVTLALLPLFIEAARRQGAYFIAGALAVSFVAFLVYSAPATIGRTGEVKVAKVAAAQDYELIRSERAALSKNLEWSRTEMLAECVGAPDPLPPNGWPRCRRLTASVTAQTERLGKLEASLSDAAPAMGDIGSETVAWALSPLGVGQETVRRLGLLGFGLGLDMVIWSLVAFATSHRIGGVPAIERRAPKPVPGPSFEPVLTRREEVIEWVQGYRDANGRDPTFTEVKNAFGLPKSTASRYRQEALDSA